MASKKKKTKTTGKSKKDPLETYRAKRSAEATTEPFAQGTEKPRLFVIHKHHATRLHYDLRLEWGGVLRSWAVPKPPSRDPAIKRLAVRVEDHPIEYADFEGVIPKGEYGAGPVIVWDRGTWTNMEPDPEQAHEDGKIGFELNGFKLRGRFALVRTKDSKTEWLLIKKPDEYAAQEGTYSIGAESILSGLTIEEMRAGGTNRGQEIRDELEELGAKKRTIKPQNLKVMNAETSDTVFSRADWIYEMKYDGFRLLAARAENGTPRLFYRSGNESTDAFPDLTRAVRALPYKDLIMDGEVCVLDELGRPNFHSLQMRVMLTKKADLDRATVRYPAILFLFDLLYFEGYDLRGLPLLDRKRLLKKVVPPSGPLRYADHIEEKGEAMFTEVQKLGLEGVMAKDAASTYKSGTRTNKWLKFKTEETGDFIIVGYKKPRGTRTGFGSVHLAGYDGGKLVYVGRAGSGFSETELIALHPKLDAKRVKKPVCVNPSQGGEMPRGPENIWTDPEFVAEIRFKQMTEEGILREPVFVRLRDDKSMDECEVPKPTYAREPPEMPIPVQQDATEHKIVRLSNLDKVFWPGTGYTKGDLVNYYDTVAPWLMPYLRDRPVVLTRYPDGIEGKNFYQKNAPAFIPGWVRTQRMWSESSQREIDYFVADDEQTLSYMVNLGTIPLHIWMSRTVTLPQPDWCLLDLDPKEAPFEHVVLVAKAIKKLCDDIELPTYVKTSGSTGLHVFVPLGKQFNYKQSRTLGQLIGNLIQAEHPDICSMKRVISDREGKVYIDFLQNRHGQLMVAPYSVRARPGAPVSTPLEWREVTRKLDIQKFTIKTVPARLKKKRADPILPVLEEKPDLLKALGNLQRRLDEESD